MSTEVLNQLKSLTDSVNEQKEKLKEQSEKFLKDVQSKQTALDEALVEQANLRNQISALEMKMGEMGSAKREEARSMSLGESIVNSELFNHAKLELASTQVARSFQVKSALLSADEQGNYLGGAKYEFLNPNSILRLQNSIRDLMHQDKTDQPAIMYPRELAFNNAASTVKEGTLKPESELKFKGEIAPVITIAHFIVASKQVLDDVKQLIGYINTSLLEGLRRVEDVTILHGSGASEELMGLYTIASELNEDLVSVENKTLVDKIRIAMAQLSVKDLYATGIVLNPIDWATIELNKDSTGRYIVSSPYSNLSMNLWGVPVVVSPSIQQGKFLVGDFMSGARIYDREDANIVISTEDKDNFVKNMVTIRAEERVAMPIYRPAAFIKG